MKKNTQAEELKQLERDWEWVLSHFPKGTIVNDKVQRRIIELAASRSFSIIPPPQLVTVMRHLDGPPPKSMWVHIVVGQPLPTIGDWLDSGQQAAE